MLYGFTSRMWFYYLCFLFFSSPSLSTFWTNVMMSALLLAISMLAPGSLRKRPFLRWLMLNIETLHAFYEIAKGACSFLLFTHFWVDFFLTKWVMGSENTPHVTLAFMKMTNHQTGGSQTANTQLSLIFRILPKMILCKHKSLAFFQILCK